MYKSQNNNADVGADNEILYFVFEYSGGRKRVICKTDEKSWENSLKYWNSSRYPYFKWTDYKVDDNKFIRTVGDYKFHICNGSVMFVFLNKNTITYLIRSCR